MNKEYVRQKMLDIVGDIYNAKVVEHGLNGYTKFDGHTLDEAKDAINKAFDYLTIDHPKVKLPREVGEELDEYKRGFEHDIDVLDLLADVGMGLSELLKTNKWLYDSDGDRSDHANSLIDAYRYGWEAELEELFYVEAPENWNAAVGQEYRWVSMHGGEFNLTVKGQAQTFTRAELKLYHLDSDIFTLVPVGEEK
jgi:hypothetical protein